MGVAGAISAAAAVIGAGYGIYSGEQSHRMQEKSFREQQAAQNEAKTNALRQRKLAEEAQEAANAKTPDISSLLAFEQQPGGFSTSSLYNDGGKRSKLSRPTLLGDSGGGGY